jgi:hypothetical protein
MCYWTLNGGRMMQWIENCQWAPYCDRQMEAVCFSETLVPTFQITRYHSTVDRNINLHHNENLISYISVTSLQQTKASEELAANLTPNPIQQS